MLEFPHDDTGGDQEDALFEMSFFVPKENDRYAVTEGDAMQEVSCIVRCRCCSARSIGHMACLIRSCACACMVWGHLHCPVCCGHLCKSSGA